MSSIASMKVPEGFADSGSLIRRGSKPRQPTCTAWVLTTCGSVGPDAESVTGCFLTMADASTTRATSCRITRVQRVRDCFGCDCGGVFIGLSLPYLGSDQFRR